MENVEDDRISDRGGDTRSSLELETSKVIQILHYFRYLKVKGEFYQKYFFPRFFNFDTV
jgi:hypothetical protein